MLTLKGINLATRMVFRLVMCRVFGMEFETPRVDIEIFKDLIFHNGRRAIKAGKLIVN